jgi:hypothetical protein
MNGGSDDRLLTMNIPAVLSKRIHSLTLVATSIGCHVSAYVVTTSVSEWTAVRSAQSTRWRSQLPDVVVSLIQKYVIEVAAENT